MTAPAAMNAVLAVTRFGFAARPGELDRVSSDPRGWALGQLRAAPASLPADLPPASRMVAQMLEQRRDKDQGDRKEANEQIKAVYFAEIEARIRAAAETDAPLLERLTHFWSNHFTVSGFRPFVRGFAAAFEREAIRPHVTGRFADMLLAAERHPAMLLYLDNAQSVGPESMAGVRRGKGINENLGREILELHTLGVDGGYTQQDVEALARILTGWSVARLASRDAGEFEFYPQLHEPGAKRLLGRTYDDRGYAEGVAALRDLASHPATARHVAAKLARHFIADDPPPETVAHIAAVFSATGGDLKAVTAAVINSDAVWAKPFDKFRTPDDLVIAACRASGFTPPAPMLAQSLKELNQLPFYAPSPAGWPDDAASWVSPESVLRRAEWCETFANRLPDPPDPVEIADASLGEALHDDTLQAIRRAPSRRDGLALLFASPEFQRR
ncbi:MAG: DUF1800 domain-containing protein [Stellaceae bacterium]